MPARQCALPAETGTGVSPVLHSVGSTSRQTQRLRVHPHDESNAKAQGRESPAREAPGVPCGGMPGVHFCTVHGSGCVDSARWADHAWMSTTEATGLLLQLKRLVEAAETELNSRAASE